MDKEAVIYSVDIFRWEVLPPVNNSENRDTSAKSQAPAEKRKICIGEKISSQRDSNPRPSGYMPDALTSRPQEPAIRTPEGTYSNHTDRTDSTHQCIHHVVYIEQERVLTGGDATAIYITPSGAG